MKTRWIIIPTAAALVAIGALALMPVWLPLSENLLNPPVLVDRAMRQQAIDALAARLQTSYVFPDKAEKIGATLRQRLQEGKYDRIQDGEQLALQLTSDMRAVAHDQHMSVQFKRAMLPPDFARQPPPQTLAEAEQRDGTVMSVINRVGRSLADMGVQKVDHLTPHIGYLRLSGFPPPFLVDSKYAAAMNKLADTDALIIDLRRNSGGHPQGVALMASYFVDRPTRLNDIWDRESNVTTEQWTAAVLDGKRYGGKKPVIILTGPQTMSAGEDFAYTMQAMKRATLIGASTWGGAHPTRPYRLGDHFYALIPGRRSISPITHGNWEGSGVIPDIAAAPDQSLAMAKDMLERRLQASARQAAAK